MIFFSIRTYSAPTVVEDYHDSACNTCCTIDCSKHPASELVSKERRTNHRGFFLANNNANTLPISLHNAPIFLKPFSQLRVAKHSQHLLKNFQKISAKCLHQWAWPDCEEQEMEDHITQLTLSGDFNLVFTRFLSQNQSKLVPKMVHRTPYVPKNGL